MAHSSRAYIYIFISISWGEREGGGAFSAFYARALERRKGKWDEYAIPVRHGIRDVPY